MAVKKKRRNHRNRVQTGSYEAARLAAHLAPPEETGNNNGSIVVDTGALNLPKDFIEENKQTQSRAFSVDPVVAAIFLLSLAFIAFIAFLIWNGFEPPT